MCKRKIICSLLTCIIMTTGVLAYEAPIREVITNDTLSEKVDSSKEPIVNTILEKTEVEKVIRDKVGIDESYTLENAYFNTNDIYEMGYWRLYFNNKDSKSIYVEADAENGNVLSISY